MNAIEKLNQIISNQNKNAKKIRKKVFKFKPEILHGESRNQNDIPIDEINNDEYLIDSYNIPEEMFKKDCLPIQARGLFAWNNEIIIRGYDKFFNVGEVKETQWEDLEKNMIPPFHVSVKENGCIIFVGVIDGHLLVTSKHALGSANNFVTTHSEKGKEWLLVHLKNAQKSERDLAAYLTKNNITAVFELVDNTFEEHILEYSNDCQGLILHGCNKNSSILQTIPYEEIESFANEFGLTLVKYKMLMSLKEVQSLINSLQEFGSYEDRFIEGLVVRGKRLGRDYLFKFKFDFPYLIFREWREATILILKKSNLPRQFKFASTHIYIQWVLKMITVDPPLFRDFIEGKGIITVRNLFLKHVGLDAQKTDVCRELKEVLAKIENTGFKLNIGEITETGMLKNEKCWMDNLLDDFSVVLLMPVGVVGCGKTTLGIYLNELLQIPHVQSDNCSGKKEKAALFIRSVLNKYKEGSQVVYADKNNHTAKLRKDLMDAFFDVYPNGRVVAICWNIRSENMSNFELKQLLGNRILTRGENHQSLKPDKRGTHFKAISSFLHQYECIDISKERDGLIDYIVRVNLNWSPQNILQEVCAALARRCPMNHEIERVTEALKNYNAITGLRSELVVEDATYYCVQISPIIFAQIIQHIESSAAENELLRKTLSIIKDQNGMTISPHITLAVNPDIYQNSDKAKNASLYRTYQYRWSRLPPASYKLKYLVFSEQLICVRVDLDDRFRSCNAYTHITIGTRNGVRPFMSNVLLEAIYSCGPNHEKYLQSHQVGSIELPQDEFYGEVVGYVKKSMN